MNFPRSRINLKMAYDDRVFMKEARLLIKRRLNIDSLLCSYKFENCKVQTYVFSLSNGHD